MSMNGSVKSVENEESESSEEKTSFSSHYQIDFLEDMNCAIDDPLE